MVTVDEGPAASGASAVERANALAFERLTSADPWVVDVRTAREVMPGYKDNLVLTSGAPMEWSDYTGGQREALIGGVFFYCLGDDRDVEISLFGEG